MLQAQVVFKEVEKEFIAKIKSNPDNASKYTKTYTTLSLLENINADLNELENMNGCESNYIQFHNHVVSNVCYFIDEAIEAIKQIDVQTDVQELKFIKDHIV